MKEGMGPLAGTLGGRWRGLDCPTENQISLGRQGKEGMKGRPFFLVLGPKAPTSIESKAYLAPPILRNPSISVPPKVV